MNFFQKNKIIIWILAGLLIVALSALGTMVYHTWQGSISPPVTGQCSRNCSLLSEELGLSAEQEQNIKRIQAECRQTGIATADSLRLKRSELVSELSREVPDTIHLRKLALTIGQLQSQLTDNTIDLYLQINRECSPSQREKLSSLFYELMGCCKQGEGNMMRKRCMNKMGN